MTDEHDGTTPRELPDRTLVYEYNAPTPDEIAQAKADLRAARASDAAVRIRRFLELWNSAEDIIGFNEEFRLDPADLGAVLTALDACTVPTGFIELPAPLSEQEYEELKAKWIAAHGQPRLVVTPTDDETFGMVRRWIRMRPRGGGA